MKKLITILMFVLFAGIAFGQDGPGVQSDKKFKNPRINSNMPVVVTGSELNSLDNITGNMKEKIDSIKVQLNTTVDASTLYSLKDGSVHRLLVDNTEHSLTGSTNLTTLYTGTIAGGKIGLNGQIQIKTIWTCNNSAGTKACVVRINGVAVQSSTLSNHLSSQLMSYIENQNSLSSQVGFSGGLPSPIGVSTTAIVTYTINTAAEMTVTVTGQLQTGTDNMSLRSIRILGIE